MKLIKIIIGWFCLGLLSGCTTPANSPNIKQFIQHVSNQDNFDQTQLTQLFRHYHPDRLVVNNMTAPKEQWFWNNYRALFVTPERAREGAIFWRQHQQTLAYASQTYGIPPEIIVAILGVETRYGSVQSHYSAFNTLATLAFAYPPRENYFQTELEQFLLLSRDLTADPLTLKSSYAGALGQAQFMPSSYRLYAVAYNHPGYGNLFDNNDDAIVSIANYFHHYGWQPDNFIAVPATLKHPDADLTALAALKPKFTLHQLAQQGIYPAQKIPAQQTVDLISLPLKNGTEYWLGSYDFYVLSRYNPSSLYAMAVYQLSQEIKHYYQLG